MDGEGQVAGSGRTILSQRKEKHVAYAFKPNIRFNKETERYEEYDLRTQKWKLANFGLKAGEIVRYEVPLDAV